LLHTHPSPPHEAYCSPEQAALYHTISPKLVAVVTPGGLLVNVPVIASKVGGFKPGRGRCVFKDDKIRSTTSFGWEVKPSDPIS
jgi:hypothetical protein